MLYGQQKRFLRLQIIIEFGIQDGDSLYIKNQAVFVYKEVSYDIV